MPRTEHAACQAKMPRSRACARRLPRGVLSAGAKWARLHRHPWDDGRCKGRSLEPPGAQRESAPHASRGHSRSAKVASTVLALAAVIDVALLRVIVARELAVQRLAIEPEPLRRQ